MLKRERQLHPGQTVYINKDGKAVHWASGKESGQVWQHRVSAIMGTRTELQEFDFGVG